MLTLTEGVAGGLAVSGAVRIDSVIELREALKLCVEGMADIVIDLCDVQECDTAGLQAIIAAHKSAAAAGKRFRVRAASPEVRETAAALGIDWEGIVNGDA